MRSKHLAVIPVTAALLATLYFGCKATGSNSRLRDTTPPAADSTAAAALTPGPACAAACADVSNEPNWAVCYSCRCKAAMDGYLPTASEISCSQGTELKIFRLEGSGATAQINQVTGTVPDCLNPDRLREGCHPGTRLVQIKHGDVLFKAICKRESFVQNYNDLSIPFDETGFIGHNNRTGATCFWNDMGENSPGLVSGINQPEIDLTDGSPAKVATYLKTYYNVKDSNCTFCHDNDPFMYDPHLTTSGWVSDSAYTNGPYNVVKIDGTAGRVPYKQLVSDDAAACTSCHRIADGNTCKYWAMDSMGFSEVPVLQAAMHANGGQWGVITDPVTNIKWTLPYWMPKSGSPPSTLESWNETYGTALATIKKCCANPAAAGCDWQDIPATAEEAAN